MSFSQSRTGARLTAFALGAALVALAACADAPTAPARATMPNGPRLDAADSAASGEIAPAAPAKWTVMVYLAADGDVGPAGVADVDEMEAGVAALATAAAARGAAPGSDVQVVVETEFGKQYLQQAGCATPACVRLPSANTVRFAVAGRDVAGGDGEADEHGPVGPVQDLGANRDMSRPEELREFVAWAKRVRPADHYLLVLSNRGAADRLVTIDAMHQGLTDAGAIDVVDFDMSLTAGYETLAKVVGLADYAVLSEATVPDAGNDYTALLRGLGESIAEGGDAAAPRAVAALAADLFHASYESGSETTTVSAYDLAGFADFEASLDSLAEGLRVRLAGDARDAVVAPLRDAVASSQRFEDAPRHDVVDVLDSLAARTQSLGDDRLAALIADVKARATAPEFRLRALARSGTATNALKVDRATGLDILWPSGDAADAIRDAGPSSLEAYQQLLPDKAWTRFLTDYLARSATAAAYDQEDRPLQAFLLWDPEANAKGADVDLWIIEPDGNLYIPYLGRVTPNGQLTADSYETGNPFEGYATFRFVTRGTYYILANLAQDSADTRPAYDFAYRHGTEEDFSLLYDEPPHLSFESSWQLDDSVTFGKVLEGAYTDLQLVAEWTPGGTSEESADSRRAVKRPDLVPAVRGRDGRLAGVARSRGTMPGAARTPTPRLTRAQLETVRRLVAARPSRLRARIPSSLGIDPAVRRALNRLTDQMSARLH
jgi:hypothetical protein